MEAVSKTGQYNLRGRAKVEAVSKTGQYINKIQPVLDLYM